MKTWHINLGAQVSVMGAIHYTKQLGELTSADRRIIGPNGEDLQTIGMATMHLHSKAAKVLEKVYVVRHVDQLLLGQPAIEELGLVTHIPGAFRIRAINVDGSAALYQITMPRRSEYASTSRD